MRVLKLERFFDLSGSEQRTEPSLCDLKLQGSADPAPSPLQFDLVAGASQLKRMLFYGIFILVIELSAIHPLHVLEQFEQVVERMRCIADRKVGEDVLVICADFGLGQHLPHMLA